jgi:hypothetical protein
VIVVKPVPPFPTETGTATEEVWNAVLAKAEPHSRVKTINAVLIFLNKLIFAFSQFFKFYHLGGF